MSRASRGVGAVLVAGALLASCGGGSSQQEVFQAKRLLSFGDDASVLTASGRKYSVNGLNTSGVVDCNLEPLWIQSVAALYGFGFAECSLNPSDTPRAKTFATPGAVVADVTAQVEAQVAAGGFRDGDIATLLAGTNDILALYRQYPARAESELIAEAHARGRQLAGVVNRLVGLGVKVLVSDLPDVGLTPFALNERTQFGDTDRAALMSRLTTAFNEQLGVNVVLDGRFVGLVQAQLRFQAIQRSPVSFGFVNITQGVCLVALLNCTDRTVLAGVTPQQALWADDTRLAPGGQSQLANLATDRARRNPF
ncbi:MAG: esterase [Rubrivivax sp.]